MIAAAAFAMAGCSDKNSYISVVSREDGSGTRSAFIELFGIEERDAKGNRRDCTTVEAVIANSTGFVLCNVAGDPNAIGYVSMGTQDGSVKALKIDGADPTADNIKNGSYGIFRSFVIVTNGRPGKAAQDFIDFILSERGQSVVEQNGYIPAVDAPGTFESILGEGKVVIAGSSSVSPIMERLIEAYEKENPNAVIELQINDSATGIHAVMDKSAEIGMISRELRDSESSLSATVIAKDGITVIVNLENPVEGLGREEVKDIFTGKTIRW